MKGTVESVGDGPILVSRYVARDPISVHGDLFVLSRRNGHSNRPRDLHAILLYGLQ